MCQRLNTYVYMREYLSRASVVCIARKHRKLTTVCTFRYLQGQYGTWMGISVRNCVQTLVLLYVGFDAHIFLLMCIFVHMYIYIYICIYSHVYIDTHTHTAQ